MQTASATATPNASATPKALSTKATAIMKPRTVARRRSALDPALNQHLIGTNLVLLSVAELNENIGPDNRVKIQEAVNRLDGRVVVTDVFGGLADTWKRFRAFPYQEDLDAILLYIAMHVPYSNHNLTIITNARIQSNILTLAQSKLRVQIVKMRQYHDELVANNMIFTQTKPAAVATAANALDAVQTNEEDVDAI